MKNILFKIALLAGLAAAVMVPLAWKFDSGYVDPFYTRLTTDKSPSLIIGTSRAAQGIQPQAFSALAPKMQNIAFTLSHSPFGPAYLDFIKEKLEEKTTDGLFLVAVDPWAVSSLDQKEKDPKYFRENDTFISKIHLKNVNPNFEYMLRFYQEPLYNALISRKKEMRLHKNGWLEVNIRVDSVDVQNSIKRKLKDYEKYASNGALSPVRLQALEETISYLKQHGKVFLVRLPVSVEFATLENKYSPDFDMIMQQVAESHGLHYLNYFDTSGEYETTDGNHLHKVAGKALSRKVAADIQHIARVAAAHENRAPL